MSISDNPFAEVLQPVTGENFIGRELLLRNLQNNAIKGAATNIIGLPRMGKTSLVLQCFIEDKHRKKWVEEKYIPIYVEMPQDPDLGTLWREIAGALDEFFETDVLPPIYYYDELLKCETEESQFRKLREIQSKLARGLKIKFILIIDEFDRVLKIPNSAGLFQRIRWLSRDWTTVICSRRTLSFIEKTVTGSVYNTNIFKQLYVGVFSDTEVEAYWAHYMHAFSSFSPNHFLAYKQLIMQYAGNHPMLMSLSNNALFELGGDPHECWNPDLSLSEREDVERKIRIAVNEEFQLQIHYVKEQELLNTAIQLVVGADHRIDEKELAMLINYQFIRVVTTEEKKDLFGYDLGPTTADCNHRYICLSTLTSHILKDTFDPDISGYDLLRKTEIRLRELVSVYLKRLCKCDYPFEIDNNGRELWEGPFFNKVSAYLPDDGHAVLKKNMDEMYKIRIQREKNDCKPAYDRKRINMLSSSTLGQLWFVFMKWQWSDFFGSILDKSNCFHDNPDGWYNQVFLPIRRWRNAANHYYDEELSDAVISTASNYASSVCRCIESWLGEGVGKVVI